MIQLKRILFPTDFSECSKRAQAYACALAEQFQSELHVLNVFEDAALLLPEGGPMLSLPPYYLAEQKQAAEKALATVLPANWTSGKQIVRTTQLGNPAVEIITYAKTNAIDMIVLGTHGRSGLVHLLLGSVAEKVVRRATCPVLTVHPEGHQFVG